MIGGVKSTAQRRAASSDPTCGAPAGALSFSLYRKELFVSTTAGVCRVNNAIGDVRLARSPQCRMDGAAAVCEVTVDIETGNVKLDSVLDSVLYAPLASPASDSRHLAR